MDTVKVLNDEICKECNNGIGRVVGSESDTNVGWQDIKTAPKDGREILTYSEKWGVKQLCWRRIKYKEGTNGSLMPEHKQGAWVLFNGDPNEMGCFNPTNEITEWMPVPKHGVGV